MYYQIIGINGLRSTAEICVEVNGKQYLVIYGKHINGGFICIPNFNTACEAGEPDDTLYNAEALWQNGGIQKEDAKALAQAVCDVFTSHLSN